MAEAIGVAAAIIQLAGFGLSAAKELHQFADTIRTHSKQVKRLARHVEQNASLLEKLRKLLEDDEEHGIYVKDDFKQDILRNVESCHEILRRLMQAVDTGKKNREEALGKSKFSKFIGRSKFALKNSDKIEKFRNELSQCEITLQLMLVIHWRPPTHHRGEVHSILNEGRPPARIRRSESIASSGKGWMDDASRDIQADSKEPLQAEQSNQALSDNLLSNLGLLRNSSAPPIAQAVDNFLTSISQNSMGTTLVHQTNLQDIHKETPPEKQTPMSMSKTKHNSRTSLNCEGDYSIDTADSHSRSSHSSASLFSKTAHSNTVDTMSLQSTKTGKDHDQCFSNVLKPQRTMWIGKKDISVPKLWVFDKAPISRRNINEFVLNRASLVLDILSDMDRDTYVAIQEHVERLQEDLLAIHVRRQQHVAPTSESDIRALNFVTEKGAAKMEEDVRHNEFLLAFDFDSSLHTSSEVSDETSGKDGCNPVVPQRGTRWDRDWLTIAGSASFTEEEPNLKDEISPESTGLITPDKLVIEEEESRQNAYGGHSTPSSYMTPPSGRSMSLREAGSRGTSPIMHPRPRGNITQSRSSGGPGLLGTSPESSDSHAGVSSRYDNQIQDEFARRDLRCRNNAASTYSPVENVPKAHRETMAALELGSAFLDEEGHKSGYQDTRQSSATQADEVGTKRLSIRTNRGRSARERMVRQQDETPEHGDSKDIEAREHQLELERVDEVLRRPTDSMSANPPSARRSHNKGTRGMPQRVGRRRGPTPLPKDKAKITRESISGPTSGDEAVQQVKKKEIPSSAMKGFRARVHTAGEREPQPRRFSAETGPILRYKTTDQEDADHEGVKWSLDTDLADMEGLPSPPSLRLRSPHYSDTDTTSSHASDAKRAEGTWVRSEPEPEPIQKAPALARQLTDPFPVSNHFSPMFLLEKHSESDRAMLDADTLPRLPTNEDHLDSTVAENLSHDLHSSGDDDDDVDFLLEDYAHKVGQISNNAVKIGTDLSPQNYVISEMHNSFTGPKGKILGSESGTANLVPLSSGSNKSSTSPPESPTCLPSEKVEAFTDQLIHLLAQRWN